MAENSIYRTSNNIFAHSGAPTEIIKLVDTVKAKYPNLLNKSLTIGSLGKYPEVYNLVSKILEYGKNTVPLTDKFISDPDFKAYAGSFYQEYQRVANNKNQKISLNPNGLPYVGTYFKDSPKDALGGNSSMQYASKITTGFGTWLGALGNGHFFNNRDNQILGYLQQININSDPASDAKNLNEALRLYFNKAKGLYATNDEIETSVEAEFKNVINNVFMDKYNRQKDSEALTEKFFEAAKAYNLVADWLGITN